MPYDLLNAIGITFLALGGLWIFSQCVVLHKKNNHQDDQTDQKVDSK